MRAGVIAGSRVRVAVAVAVAAMATGRAAHATHGVVLSALTQQNSDGTTLPTGGMPTTGTIWLTATSDASTCGTTADLYYLDIELQPLATAFTNTPTNASPSMTKPSCIAQVYPVIVISGLAPGDYHWQARERAPISNGPWSAYASGVLAFTTGPAPRLTLSPSSINFGNQAITGADNRDDDQLGHAHAQRDRGQRQRSVRAERADVSVLARSRRVDQLRGDVWTHHDRGRERVGHLHQ
jgi:hypothetical protein